MAGRRHWQWAVWLGLATAGCTPTADGEAGPKAADSADTGAWVAGPSDRPGSSAARSVCINELMASNDVSLVLDDGETPDWIELHNPSGEPVSLRGWTVVDLTTDRAAPLDALAALPARGFLVLLADGTEQGGVHLPFTLPRDGGGVRLARPDGGGDQVAYGTTATDVAHARTEDCCASAEVGCWDTRFGGTPGASNVAF